MARYIEETDLVPNVLYKCELYSGQIERLTYINDGVFVSDDGELLGLDGDVRYALIPEHVLKDGAGI